MLYIYVMSEIMETYLLMMDVRSAIQTKILSPQLHDVGLRCSDHMQN